MNVRRERTHQSGLTNIDFRTKGDQGNADRYKPSLKFADVGTMTKTGFKQMVNEPDMKDSTKIRGGWAFIKRQDPRCETTTEFYKS